MTKLTAITKENTTYADGDLFYGVDISDTADHATGSSFKSTYVNLRDDILAVSTIIVELTQAVQSVTIKPGFDYTINGDATLWRDVITSPLIADAAADDEASALVVKSGTTMTLNDVAIINARGHGVLVEEGGELIMNHCWIANCSKDGVHAPRSRVTIDQCLIENCGTSSAHSQINSGDAIITRSILDGCCGRGEVVQGKGRLERCALIGDAFYTGTWIRDRCTAVRKSTTVPAQGFDAGNHLLSDLDGFLPTYGDKGTAGAALIRPAYRVLMWDGTDSGANSGYGMYDFNTTITQAWATTRWGSLGHTYVLKTGLTAPQMWVALPFFPGETP